MTPTLALTICFIFILFLLKIEHNCEANISFALWIPTIWFTIIGSRMVYLWLNPEPSALGATEATLEGNPVDPIIFTALILAGILILARRNIYWVSVVKRNPWLFIYFLFCGISIFWSDFPLTTFKRYIKATGSLIMMLIIFTEPVPIDAIRAMIRRCAYFIAPLSIVLIKYYPHLGRIYHRWTGELMITGVSTNKNGLGALSMMCSIILVADIISAWHTKSAIVSHNKVTFMRFITLLMTIWLLIKSNSATSLACFIIGCLTFVGMSIPVIKNNVRKIGIYIFFLLLVGLVLQYSMDIITIAILALGRDPTLTGRTEIWNFALSMVAKPLIGSGFESFWLGDNVEKITTAGMQIGGEVHNGYIEAYLDLGLLGLFLLTAVIIKSYKNINEILKDDFEFGRLLMVFFIMLIFYNVTESAFRPMQLLGFVFLIVAFSHPHSFFVSERASYRKAIH